MQVGDLVLARDESTGETAYKPITHVFVNDELTVWMLDVIDENGLTETHHVTSNHPYAAVGLGWLQVAELQPGMLLESEDGTRVTVLGAQDTWVVQRTYNLEVADFHTFFVGERRVLVHNSELCNWLEKRPNLAIDEAKKVPAPTVKSSRYGGKISDEVPTEGVPSNWSREQIEDAIIDYRASITSRKRELADFDAIGGGSEIQRLAHTRRITIEETFLKSLEKALGR